MYKVIIPKYALKELSKITKENQQLIFNKIKDLESGIFDNDKLLITVIRVAHRKEVY